MKEKILVTSALPYVNSVPHLGNLIGAVLSADVYARFQRSFGNETLFICGTDEHGTATETKALEEGVTPKEICDKYYSIHKEIYDWFNISFDEFGRTSTDVQTELTQEIFLRLYDKGYITEERVEQLYCRSCDKFLADRFVEGTCPKCGYEDARGDQCDNCSNMLNATELISPRCKICGGTPEIKETEHLFIDLPKLKDKLLAWIDTRSKEGGWSNNAKTMTYAWIKEGLKKRAISRDLKWGVPIPLDRFRDKVFYVWFDAPIGYLSITKKAFPDQYEGWWMNDYKDGEGVKLVQFMGKDNIPFHTIVFPSSLLGTGEPYTMLYRISSTEYLNYEDQQFSKSRGIGVFGQDAKDTGIPPDVFRYYLLINRPERSDSQFKWDDLQDKNNNELVANIGNLVNRTVTFLKRFFNNSVPMARLTTEDKEFLGRVKEMEDTVTQNLKDVELKEALKNIMRISKLANGFFQESEPWKLVKTDNDRAGTVMFILANVVKDLGVLVSPYTPETSKSIFRQLGIEERQWTDLGLMTVKAGQETGEPEILFRKIEDKQAGELKSRFSGVKTFPLRLAAARITEAKLHPDSEKLIIIQADLGKEKRQIVAGLQGYYKPEELVGKTVVIVANLKKAKLGGAESNGMILAAEEGEKVVILETDARPGEVFAPEGHELGEKEVTYKEFSKTKLEVRSGKLFADDNPVQTPQGNSAKADVADKSAVH